MTALYWTLAVLGTFAIIGFIVVSYIFHACDEEDYESECYNDEKDV